MKQVVLIILCCVSSMQLKAQQENLKIESTTAYADSVKFDSLSKVFFKAIFTDKKEAEKLMKECEWLANKLDSKYNYINHINNKGVFYGVYDQRDSAKKYFKEALLLSKKYGIKIHETNALNNLGMFYWNNNQLDSALYYFFESLKLSEKIGNKKVGSNYNNIGLIYQDMNLESKAKIYHQKALKIRLEQKNEMEVARSYLNLGVCNKNLDLMEEAKDDFKKAIDISKRLKIWEIYFLGVKGLGDVYFKENQYEAALKQYLILEQYNDHEQMVDAIKVSLMSNMAQVYNALHQPQKALSVGKEALSLIEKDSIYSNEITVYHALSDAYYALGNLKEGRKYSELFLNKTIDFYKVSNTEALHELEKKYEIEKKDNELAIQKAQITGSSLKIKNRNQLLLSAILAIITLATITGFLWYRQRVKQQQFEEEKRITAAQLEIENNTKLEKQRLRISRDLHDNIGAQLTFIISSIDGLKNYKTDNHFLQKIDTINGFAKDTINELRDTIWAMSHTTINGEMLHSRIANFLERANTAKDDMQFIFNYDTAQLYMLSFTSFESLNLYRIIQEAVNNAVKHAAATSVWVALQQQEKHIIITIKDNGKGWDIDKNTYGNGLYSMKKRAKDLESELTINTSESGTTITLNFNHNEYSIES